MEETIIISCNKEKPFQDFIKDKWEVLENKTTDGLKHFHLIEKTEEVEKID